MGKRQGSAGAPSSRRPFEEGRLYAELVRHVQIGLSVWMVEDPDDPRTFRLLAFNPAAERVARMPLDSFVGASLVDIAPYAEGGQVQALLAAVARDGGVRETVVERSRNPSDPTRALAVKVFPLTGGRIGLAAEDITVATRARLLRDAEQRILEMVASSAELQEILDAVTRLVEEFAPPALASVLLLDADGAHVRHGSAPNLPADYTRAIDGLAIGPKAGSCGTAAFTGKPVYVTDIEIDPLWEDYRELARAAGLRACWSTPIFARDGRVLGTFALYYREPRAPNDDDRALIARATDIAGIAIHRRQLEGQLRELSAHVERAREEERTGIAREIHDVLGQALTALKMDIAWIARRSAEAEISREALREKARSMADTTSQMIADVRRISAELRPGVLDHLGLLAAFEWQAQDFAERTGTACVVTSNVGDAPFDRDVSTALFRILQEALTNVARHAEAKHVDVRLDRDGEALHLEVRDDGRGIAAARARSMGALGLLGIRERARRLGGTAKITGAPGVGTVVDVTVPLARAAARAGAR